VQHAAELDQAAREAVELHGDEREQLRLDDFFEFLLVEADLEGREPVHVACGQEHATDLFVAVQNVYEGSDGRGVVVAEHTGLVEQTADSPCQDQGEVQQNAHAHGGDGSPQDVHEEGFVQRPVVGKDVGFQAVAYDDLARYFFEQVCAELRNEQRQEVAVNTDARQRRRERAQVDVADGRVQDDVEHFALKQVDENLNEALEVDQVDQLALVAELHLTDLRGLGGVEVLVFGCGLLDPALDFHQNRLEPHDYAGHEQHQSPHVLVLQEVPVALLHLVHEHLLPELRLVVVEFDEAEEEHYSLVEHKVLQVRGQHTDFLLVHVRQDRVAEEQHHEEQAEHDQFPEHIFTVFLQLVQLLCVVSVE